MKEIITLSNHGCDRATAYRMSNKILRRPDGLYATWIDAQFRNIITRVDPDTGEFEEIPPLVQGFDNHCGGALAETPDGNMHFMAGSHGQAFIHRYSSSPLDEGSWSLPRAIGIGATYPSMVCDQDGALHLVHRTSQLQGPWYACIVKRPLGDDWTWPYVLVEMPAPKYSFPLNSLTIGPDGVLHLLIEFYKTYRDDLVRAHTAAITHLSSSDGAQTWSHDDGREVDIAPVTLEDSHPVKYKAGGDVRPGNIIIMPDNQPAFVIWDWHAGTIELARREGPGRWQLSDLTETIQSSHPQFFPSDAPQLAVDKDGALVAICTIAPECQWGHPEAQLMILWMDPKTGTVTKQADIPKLTQGEPDWMPSIEKGTVGVPSDDLFLMYQSGKRQQICRVRLMQLT